MHIQRTSCHMLYDIKEDHSAWSSLIFLKSYPQKGDARGVVVLFFVRYT